MPEPQLVTIAASSRLVRGTRAAPQKPGIEIDLGVLAAVRLVGELDMAEQTHRHTLSQPCRVIWNKTVVIGRPAGLLQLGRPPLPRSQRSSLLGAAEITHHQLLEQACPDLTFAG